MIVNGYKIEAETNLSWANLSGADLSMANLSGADLRWANLSGADLRWADLSEANLSWADLRWANLSEADLRWANLSEANLSEADLSGAVWRTGNKIDKAPIQITGLYWPVLILDNHMQIGCQTHSFDEWERFSDKEILAMDSRNALRFWRQHKQMLITLCKEGQRKYD